MSNVHAHINGCGYVDVTAIGLYSHISATFVGRGSLFHANNYAITKPNCWNKHGIDDDLVIYSNGTVMLLTSLQQSCHRLTIECKTSSVFQNTGYFIPGLGEQCLTQMSG